MRGQGWSLVNQELEERLSAVAAPICDRTGRVVAAMNVSAHASRTSLEVVRRNLLTPLLRAVAGVEADLRAVSPRNHRR